MDKNDLNKIAIAILSDAASEQGGNDGHTYAKLLAQLQAPTGFVEEFNVVKNLLARCGLLDLTGDFTFKLSTEGNKFILTLGEQNGN